MELTNQIWQTLEGGYKIPYDVSIPLLELEQTNNADVIDNILEELWDELHHQGDVGLASYLALPQLVRIGKLKRIFNWKLIGLCLLIEQQRHWENNPIIPTEFQKYYNEGLIELKQFVLNNINRELDSTTYFVALSTLAICDGKIDLAKAISELEDENIMKEFLGNYF